MPLDFVCLYVKPIDIRKVCCASHQLYVFFKLKNGKDLKLWMEEEIVSCQYQKGYSNKKNYSNYII